jgi:hypothetical protein
MFDIGIIAHMNDVNSVNPALVPVSVAECNQDVINIT